MPLGGGQPLEVVTKFTADTQDLEQGTQKAGGLLSGVSNNALLMGAGVVAGAGIAIGAIVSMTQAAAADRDEQAKLEAAITAAGAATATSTDQVNAAIAAGQAKAFSDTQTREALTSLVTATGDVTSATALLSTAQDVARFAGVDLATAADAVAKAQAGSAGALQKLLPGLEKGKTATDTLANAQTIAAGQAELFAKTTEGQMSIASDSFGELQETIGSAFLPVIDAIVPALVPIIQKLGELIQKVIPVLIPLIEVLAEVLSAVVTAVGPLLDIVIALISLLLQALKPALTVVIAVLKQVGPVISAIAGFISDLIGWLGRAVDAIGKFLDSINPLKGISLPSLPFLSSAVAPVGAGVGARGLGAPAGRAARSGGGGVVVNVYGGDPNRITAAVRQGYRRWKELDGATAPDREY